MSIQNRGAPPTTQAQSAVPSSTTMSSSAYVTAPDAVSSRTIPSSEFGTPQSAARIAAPQQSRFWRLPALPSLPSFPSVADRFKGWKSLFSRPTPLHVPQPHVDPWYVDYARDKRKMTAHNQPMSAFTAYNPNLPRGKAIQYGRRGIHGMEYPSLSSLGQGEDSEYSQQHMSERFLPKDDSGQRATYGTHEGSAIHGPVNWSEYFMNWSDIGTNYQIDIPSGQALTDEELVFCQNHGFDFKRSLGSGGFGSVWSVNTTQLIPDPNHPGQFLAIELACKIVNLKLFEQRPLQRAIEKLLSEADLHKTLDHPNIVKCEGIFNIHDESSGFPFCRLLMFMELCDSDLSSYIKSIPSQKITEQEAKQVMIDITSALKYLHDQDICHHDIKAHNIMYVVDQGHNIYKLADFGLSKKYASEAEAVVHSPRGTTVYMPPEMLNAGPNDAIEGKPADIYSLGCVLAYCLIGPQHWDIFVNELQKDLKKSGGKNEALYIMIYINQFGLQSEPGQLICEMTRELPNNRPDIDTLINHGWLH